MKNKNNFGFGGFTLAEMMVVMLILSIVMAAFAPVMTRKSKVDLSSPWKYVEGGAGDIKYAVASASQMAMIGKNSRTADTSGRLTINTGDNAINHLIFETRGVGSGVLRTTANSILLGSLSGDANNTGALATNSIAIGQGVKSGANSVAIGSSALSANTSGENNTAIGYAALNKNQSGGDNTAIGSSALSANTSGENNTAIGSSALSANTNGKNNTAIGTNALLKNVGFESSEFEFGSKNVAIGADALSENTTGYYNTAIGYAALNKNQYGSSNTAIGYAALNKNQSGSGNTAIGHGALNKNQSGGYNTAIGERALHENVYGKYNVAIGVEALYTNKGSSTSTDGSNNIATGYQALYDNLYGSNNIATGYQALYTNKGSSTSTDGSNNIATGYQALYDNTIGSNNIATGYHALHNNLYGSNNIATGYQALYTNKGSSTSTDGSNNIATGYQALYNNTDGSNNIATGYQALYNNTAGSNNIAIGYNACEHVTGSNKTCIGKSSGPYTSRQDNNEPEDKWANDDVERIFIGSRSSFNQGVAVLEVHNGEKTEWFDGGQERKSNSNVVINGNLLVKGSIYMPFYPYGSMNANSHYNDDLISYFGFPNGCDGSECEFRVVGGGRDTTIKSKIKEMYGYFGGDKRSASDRRLKNISGANNDGLAKIKELKVYNFTFKKDPKKLPHTGVIAQELQKIFPNAVTKGEDGYLRIRWDEMFYAMINSIKELATKVDNVDSRVKVLEQENKQLKLQNQKLEARLNALEKKVK